MGLCEHSNPPNFRLHQEIRLCVPSSLSHTISPWYSHKTVALYLHSPVFTVWDMFALFFLVGDGKSFKPQKVPSIHISFTIKAPPWTQAWTRWKPCRGSVASFSAPPRTSASQGTRTGRDVGRERGDGWWLIEATWMSRNGWFILLYYIFLMFYIYGIGKWSIDDSWKLLMDELNVDHQWNLHIYGDEWSIDGLWKQHFWKKTRVKWLI